MVYNQYLPVLFLCSRTAFFMCRSCLTAFTINTAFINYGHIKKLAARQEQLTFNHHLSAY